MHVSECASQCKHAMPRMVCGVSQRSLQSYACLLAPKVVNVNVPEIHASLHVIHMGIRSALLSSQLAHWG